MALGGRLRAQRGIASVLGLLDRVTCWAVIVTCTVMVAMVVVEVFTRYVLATSVIFANELARLMFVCTVFLGLPLALIRGRHVGIGLMAAILPRPAARELFRIACLCSALLMAVVLYQSSSNLFNNWDQRLSTLPFSAGTFMLPIPIGAALCLLHLVRMALMRDPTLGYEDQSVLE